MIPIRDDVPAIRTPIVNYVMIALCLVTFVYESLLGPRVDRFVDDYGMIPARLVKGNELLVAQRPTPVRVGSEIRYVAQTVEIPPTPVSPWATLLTSMFLHGGLMHILGNMWFLWIFGDNVEDRYGHLRYLILYLGSGLAAALLHFAYNPFSTVPTVGASGAIAGVMGSYWIMFPRAKVLTAIPIFVILQFVVLPASIFLGIWFLFQLIAGVWSDPESGGVAWWAHVGGFAFGIGWTLWLRRTGHLGEPRDPVIYVPQRYPGRWR